MGDAWLGHPAKVAPTLQGPEQGPGRPGCRELGVRTPEAPRLRRSAAPCCNDRATRMQAVALILVRAPPLLAGRLHRSGKGGGGVVTTLGTGPPSTG